MFCNRPAVVPLVKRTMRRSGSSWPHRDSRVFQGVLPTFRQVVTVALCMDAVSAPEPQLHCLATHSKSGLSICSALVPSRGDGRGAEKQKAQSCLDKEEVTLSQKRGRQAEPAGENKGMLGKH